METDMKQTESNESRSSSRWLAENLEEMDQSVKQMQKLIEDGESLSKFHRPELTAHIEDFYHLYQSLAERYDHLTGELQKNVPSDIPLQGSGNTKSGFAQGSPLLTPDRKMGLHNTSCQATSSTSGGSSNFSSTTLNAKLDYERMQVLKFQERIAKVETNLSDRNNEVAELKIALSDAEEKFTSDKAQLQSEMFCLLEKQALLDARLKEWELQGKALEDKIRQCETEKMEITGLHEAQERGMQSEINQLKVEVCERDNRIEALNKIMDSLKLKYDMLMAEKDEINAKVNTLVAEARSRDNHIGQIEEHSRKLHMEHAELIAASESSRKLVDELRFRVKELENEVDRQRMVILDAAEEKREAIRQLCFSLEHYRSGYQELRQAFLGYKRPAVMAA